eukprot:gene9480-14426_t
MSGPKVRTVAEVSKRIFGHVIRAPNTRSPTKYLKRGWKGPAVEEYYKEALKPNAVDKIFKPLRALGVYQDEKRDTREEMIRSYAERGKVLVKKGEGKRQAKKK